MTLSIGTIAFRSAILWAAGLIILAAISAYTARPNRAGPVSLLAVIPIFLGMGGIGISVAGVGLMIGRSLPASSPFLQSILIGAGSIAWLWLSLILVQVAQNVGYRLVGAPVERIRWYRDHKPRRARRRRRVNS